jgi:hypothetical protein
MKLSGSLNLGESSVLERDSSMSGGRCSTVSVTGCQTRRVEPTNEDHWIYYLLGNFTSPQPMPQDPTPHPIHCWIFHELPPQQPPLCQDCSLGMRANT